MIYYIDVEKGELVTSSGNPYNAPLPRFVEAQTQSFVFAFNPGGIIIDKNFFAAEFYLTGGTIFVADAPCFRSRGIVDATAGTVTFEVDTYTQEYLNYVQLPATVMYTELTRKGADDTREVRIALMRCPADPRVYIEGVPPAPVSNYYTADEVDALLNILRGEIGDFVDDKELAAALTNYLTSSSLTAALRDYTPLKKTITDTTSTAPVIDTMVTNALYTYSQPLTSLTINNVPMSTLETDFSFTAGEGFQLYTPADVYPEMGLEFNAGGVYVINIYAKRLVAGEFSPGE